MQGFSEAQYMAETGHTMSADERQQTFANNVGMMTAFHVGGKLAEPLTGRLQGALAGISEKTQKALGAIDQQLTSARQNLSDQLTKMRATGSVELSRTNELTNDLLTKEKTALAQAEQSGQISHIDAQDLLNARQSQMAQQQLYDVAPGEVAYGDQAALDVAQHYYTSNGGKFVEAGDAGNGQKIYTGLDAQGRATSFMPVEAVGGTRGEQWRRGEKTLTQETVQQKMAALKTEKPGALVNNATLTKAEGAGNYKFELPGGGKPIDVHFELVDKADTTAHGDQTGPASLHIERNSAGDLQASIKVEKSLQADDVQRAMRHELNELSVIAERQRANPHLDIASEMQPRYLRPDIAPGETREPSAHDIATASEIAHDLVKLPMDRPWTDVTLNKPDLRLQARLAEAGFTTTAAWDGKAKALRAAGVSEDRIAKLQKDIAFNEAQKSQVLPPSSEQISKATELAKAKGWPVNRHAIRTPFRG